MISHRHRCIYIKVPKCASSTLRDWFLDHAGGRHSFRPWWYGPPLPERIQAVTRVMNLYPDYATFAFVRDPYERFVSLYLHAARRTANQCAAGRKVPAGYATLAEFAELCRDVLADVRSLWGEPARAFYSANPDRRYGPGRIPLKHLRFEIGHAQPQTEFLPDCNPDTLFGLPRVHCAPLAFIGRVERMQQDFERLRYLLGLPDVALPARNDSGFGSGANRSRRYRAFYDDRARRLVEDIYAADLRFTGCTFDGPSPAPFSVPAPQPRIATPHPPADKRAGRIHRCLSRLRFALRAAEIRFEQRIRAHARLRRALRPLKRLRGLPRWHAKAPAKSGNLPPRPPPGTQR